LVARLVVIKGFMEPDVLREAIDRQLTTMGVTAGVQIGRRRVLQVSGQTVVGYAVRLAELDEDASIAVQQEGLGGRRRFGGGLFLPSRQPIPPDTRPER
jgi:CRISPR-associated protein Cas6